MNNDRFKNPYFWFGLVAVFFTAIGVNIESLTSWNILFQDILNFLGNPFLIISAIIAITGVFVDPTTKGIKDSDEQKESQE